jgi:NTE family protein
VNEGRGGTDKRILRTLEHYFGTRIKAGDPLLDDMEQTHLAGGEWLMHQGDAGNSMYFLVRGRLQAWARSADGNEKGTFLNEIVAGDSVGEIGLLTGAPRTVGIQAIRDSLLLKIDQAAFEKLTPKHPALVLKLATNVASIVQNKSTRTKPSTRNLKAISVLPLDSTEATAEFCRQFSGQLRQEGSTLNLSPDRFGELGAPVDSLGANETVPDALVHWLHDQEDEHRFLIYQCSASSPAWTRFALRQSDMVLFIGDASSDPRPGAWERQLANEAGEAVARKMLVLLQAGSGKPIRNTTAWLADRKTDFHVHVRADQPGDIRRVARIVSGNALGLVLAGGAARGFAHLGVYQAMEELGLDVDWVGGTSLGAIMAGALASPYSTEESIELARDAFVRGKPFSDFTLPMHSLISGGRMERLLRQHLDLYIEDLPTPFYCVSCHLDTGAMKLHEHGYLPDALRASAAIPGIIPPAVVDNRLAVDGAVINNLPVDIMQHKPVGKIVAVEISSNKTQEVKYESVPSSWAVLRGRYLPFTRRHRVPGLSTIMLKATELGTLQRVQEQGKQADLLLTPPVRQFGMTEVKSFDRIVQAGYEHGMEELPKWLEQQE